MQQQALCLKYFSTHVEEVSLLQDAVPRDCSDADKESDCGITATNYFVCLSGDTKRSLNTESRPVLENPIVGNFSIPKLNGRIDMVKSTETFLLSKKGDSHIATRIQ
ncbi:hypothetical protein GQX74_014035 [Glossina fuscipes]|nr:hypothetical protein GQX74_014035 [Glossina fuscipes]